MQSQLLLRNSSMSEQIAINTAPVYQAGQPHLENFGGRLLRNPKFQSVFLGNFWNSSTGTNERAYHDRFAKYLVRSEYTSVWNQYGVNKGNFLGSTLLAPAHAAASITDKGIQQVLKRALANGDMNVTDPETVITVYLPPGVTLESHGVSSREGMGGYHSSFDLPDGRRIYYAALVYSRGDNGIDFTGNPRQNMGITASHEWTEAATDPDVNHGTLGWYDRRYGEVSDIPINLGLPLERVFGRIGRYLAQKNWSNKDSCVEMTANSCNNN